MTFPSDALTSSRRGLPAHPAPPGPLPTPPWPGSCPSASCLFLFPLYLPSSLLHLVLWRCHCPVFTASCLHHLPSSHSRWAQAPPPPTHTYKHSSAHPKKSCYSHTHPCPRPVPPCTFIECPILFWVLSLQMWRRHRLSLQGAYSLGGEQTHR